MISSLLLARTRGVFCITMFLFFVFIRSVYVRIKIDTLIKLIWFLVLPLRIVWFCMCVFIFYFMK
jgi:NADH:ubiquinone oxidoreductase subunit H